MGVSGPFIIDAGGKGTAWPLLAGGQLVCTLQRMAGQAETHIRCQDGPSNLVQCDAGDTMRHPATIWGAMECRSIPSRAILQSIDI